MHNTFSIILRKVFLELKKYKDAGENYGGAKENLSIVLYFKQDSS